MLKKYSDYQKKLKKCENIIPDSELKIDNYLDFTRFYSLTKVDQIRKRLAKNPALVNILVHIARAVDNRFFTLLERPKDSVLFLPAIRLFERAEIASIHQSSDKLGKIEHWGLAFNNKKKFRQIFSSSNTNTLEKWGCIIVEKKGLEERSSWHKIYLTVYGFLGIISLDDLKKNEICKEEPDIAENRLQLLEDLDSEDVYFKPGLILARQKDTLRLSSIIKKQIKSRNSSIFSLSSQKGNGLSYFLSYFARTNETITIRKSKESWKWILFNWEDLLSFEFPVKEFLRRLELNLDKNFASLNSLFEDISDACKAIKVKRLILVMGNFDLLIDKILNQEKSEDLIDFFSRVILGLNETENPNLFVFFSHNNPQKLSKLVNLHFPNDKPLFQDIISIQNLASEDLRVFFLDSVIRYNLNKIMNRNNPKYIFDELLKLVDQLLNSIESSSITFFTIRRLNLFNQRVYRELSSEEKNPIALLESIRNYHTKLWQENDNNLYFEEFNKLELEGHDFQLAKKILDLSSYNGLLSSRNFELNEEELKKIRGKEISPILKLDKKKIKFKHQIVLGQFSSWANSKNISKFNRDLLEKLNQFGKFMDNARKTLAFVEFPAKLVQEYKRIQGRILLFYIDTPLMPISEKQIIKKKVGEMITVLLLEGVSLDLHFSDIEDLDLSSSILRVYKLLSDSSISTHESRITRERYGLNIISQLQKQPELASIMKTAICFFKSVPNYLKLDLFKIMIKRKMAISYLKGELAFASNYAELLYELSKNGDNSKTTELFSLFDNDSLFQDESYNDIKRVWYNTVLALLRLNLQYKQLTKIILKVSFENEEVKIACNQHLEYFVDKYNPFKLIYKKWGILKTKFNRIYLEGVNLEWLTTPLELKENGIIDFREPESLSDYLKIIIGQSYTILDEDKLGSIGVEFNSYQKKIISSSDSPKEDFQFIFTIAGIAWYFAKEEDKTELEDILIQEHKILDYFTNNVIESLNSNKVFNKLSNITFRKLIERIIINLSNRKISLMEGLYSNLNRISEAINIKDRNFQKFMDSLLRGNKISLAKHLLSINDFLSKEKMDRKFAKLYIFANLSIVLHRCSRDYSMLLELHDLLTNGRKRKEILNYLFLIAKKILPIINEDDIEINKTLIDPINWNLFIFLSYLLESREGLIQSKKEINKLLTDSNSYDFLLSIKENENSKTTSFFRNVNPPLSLNIVLSSSIIASFFF